ncbi:MAG TPA: winged helix-turn-helix domain-containing tetratricopeptide repeat protein [Myxococcaceae bacterium]|nr:winged helix-turn-helix domain-containing tetratricopeptide repeat protein [Myxococcaceae bacterium]
MGYPIRFVFGDCVLDLDRRELSRRGRSIPTGPQVFDLLVYLVTNRERVVSKDDLLASVWSGRIVSDSTLASHINAVRKAIGDSGEEQRFLRTVARKGFRFVGEVSEAPLDGAAPSLADSGAADDASTAELAVADGPSIAALPFTNLSGDPEQDYFADGLVEDIITALSRLSWLFVVARNSSFTYKGQAVDVRQVGRELGVRYVLEGSVRKAANRVRITEQLVDARTRGHLWADRFEGPLDDIFSLQDQMTESVVGAIAPTLERAEIERARRKPTERLDAYDYYLRGMASFHVGTPESTDTALGLFYKAIELDPGYASAYGMAAWCYHWRKINRSMRNSADEATEAARLARRAVELGKADPVALARGGHVLAYFGGDLEGAIAAVDRSLVLNPNFAAAWYISGWERIFRGEPDDAIPRFARAMRLSPLDPELVRMKTGTAAAHLFARRFDQASAWAEKALGESPDFIVAVGVLAASHALAGRVEEARLALQHLRRLSPDMHVSTLKDWMPFRRPEDLATLADGLRRAGLGD